MNRTWLMPLDPLYRAAVAAKDLAYRRSWLRVDRLNAPVVSVGNLSVGGAGKTPLIMRLAELLAARGLSVDILSRGYGRISRGTEQVDPSGSAERFGDEPLLIAQRTGVPVFVGASRYKAGQLAEAAGQPSIHLLDDGFQHRQLARRVDIVLLHPSDLSSRLLPSGRMREPLSALRRADFLVVREQDEELQRRLRAWGFAAPVWRMRRVLAFPAATLRRGQKLVAFCGIARPEEFFSSLLNAGLDLAAKVSFADHHRYGSADVDRLAALAQRQQADAFVTTEKDAVKLNALIMERLGAVAPVEVARLEVSFAEETAVVDQLLQKLHGRTHV